MKIIFLDIDGVLNYASWNTHLEEKLVMADQSWWSEMIDPTCVECLNQIVKDVGAKVVLSSTWRLYHDIETMAEILEGKGFVGEIIGRTPARLSSQSRGGEIQSWLNSCEEDVTTFAILDDLGPNQFYGLEEYLVQTSFEEQGLEASHVKQAINILK